MVKALRDVNLEIQPGEFCAFVGPSGCGKSTLLNLVAGLDLPTSGEIVLNGRSTHNLTSYEWTKIRRETIGIIFQAFHLVHGLTAEENIALPLMLRGGEWAGDNQTGRGYVGERGHESSAPTSTSRIIRWRATTSCDRAGVGT